MPVGRPARDPDRGADADLDPAQRDRPGDRPEQPRRERVGVARLERHEHELVTALTGHEIAGSGDRRHRATDMKQQLVSGRVAERVVDQLEIVQIDVEDREAGAPADGSLDVRRQPASIGEACELILVSAAVEPAGSGAEQARQHALRGLVAHLFMNIDGSGSALIDPATDRRAAVGGALPAARFGAARLRLGGPFSNGPRARGARRRWRPRGRAGAAARRSRRTSACIRSAPCGRRRGSIDPLRRAPREARSLGSPPSASARARASADQGAPSPGSREAARRSWRACRRRPRRPGDPPTASAAGRCGACA